MFQGTRCFIPNLVIRLHRIIFVRYPTSDDELKVTNLGEFVDLKSHEVINRDIILRLLVNFQGSSLLLLYGHFKIDILNRLFNNWNDINKHFMYMES